MKRLPALVVLLLLAGCGGGSSPTTKADATSSPTATTSTTSPTGGGSSAKPDATATTRATKGSGGGASAVPATTAASAAPEAASFTAPGTYTYDSHGTITAGTPRKVDGTAELKVDKPKGTAQHSSLGGDQSATEQDVLHLSTGSYLTRLVISTGGQSKEFRPAKPVLGYPRPAAVGRSWSWSMTSTDGKTHASYSGKVARRETLTIGGTHVDAWVIDSTLKLTGDLTLTDHETTWYDEQRLLQVKTRSQASGSFSGIPFTTDMTSTLRSVKPS
ncbi:MAG: hypothetical protein JWN31_1255 [Frankiales bacterium]|nr:hypothetical protein [Frankiales bacterium]